MELEDVVCDFVHIKRNGTDGTAYPLVKKSEMVLGKDHTCDFKVQVPSACDRHAKLRVDKSGKVFVSSLVSTVPVSLNGADVLKETSVADKSIISVGSCTFRFIYRDSFTPSPLQESNKPMASPAGKQRKSVGTPKSKEKENVTTPRSARKSISRAPRSTPATTPASTTPLNKSHGSTQGGARPPTPISKKKEHVPTPTVARNRHSSVRSSLSSLSSSLQSIAEETTPQATPTTPKPDLATVTPPSKKPKRSDTPTISRSRSSQSRSSCSSMSTSLMSIREENESLASPVSPATSHKYSTGSVTTTSANANFNWLTSKSSSKPAYRRSVSFGPALSPEVFLKHMPPSTPVKVGNVPGGLRRSLPARTEALGFVAEVCEEEEEVEEGEVIETEEEVVEYSMTGFEEASSDEDAEEDEEEPIPESEGEGEESDTTPVASPVKQPALSTPIQKEIRSKPSLRQHYKKLATPLRIAIQDKPRLRSTRRALPTPLRRAIRDRPSLRKTHRSLPTPIRSRIRARPSLRSTRKALATPIRQQIESMPYTLRKTRQTLATPVRKEIESKPALRKTRQILATPVRKDIESRPALRKTRQILATPVRKEIESRPALRKTRQILATPVRKDIESRPALRKTRQTLATPVRKQIESKPALRKTRQTLATPVRKDIESRPALRKTRQILATPVRKDIESKPALRMTRQTLATPVRKDIESRPVLRKTKKSMPTPVRRAIESRPTLRKTKNTLPTPLREEIQSRPPLRQTKRCLPTPLRLAIQAERSLRKTKPTLPTPLRTAIQQRPALRSTKRSLPADLLGQLKSRPTLCKTKPALPTPLREEIQRGLALRSLHPEPQTKAAEPRSKRAYADTMLACETPVPAPPAKRRRIAKTPLTPAPSSNKTSSVSTPARSSKRAYATTVLPADPATPAKRMKIANSSTPRAYDFGPYLQPKKNSPAVNLTGLPHLFKSPRVCNSADPADVFDVKLFGESREVGFASPLATSSKKPPSRPTSAQGLQSCLKSTEPCCLFTIGVSDPLPQEKKGRGKRTRKVCSTATTTRVTRSRAVKQMEAPLPELPTRKRGRSATNNPEKENALPPPTKRTTRSRAATIDTSETRSAPAATAVASRRRSRLNKMTVHETVPMEVLPTRPRRRATVMAPINEGAPSTHMESLNNAQSIKDEQSQKPQKTEGVAPMARRSTRRYTRVASDPTPHAPAEKSVVELKQSEPDKPLRQSRRLAGVQAAQVEPRKPTSEQKPPTEVPRESGPKKARRAAKQEASAEKEDTTAPVRPSTRSSRGKVASSTAPIRRSSRLRK